MSVNTSSKAGGSTKASSGGSSKTSILAPSKFSSNFLTSSKPTSTTTSTATPDSKVTFPGFKASKLSLVTQSLSSYADKDTETEAKSTSPFVSKPPTFLPLKNHQEASPAASTSSPPQTKDLKSREDDKSESSSCNFIFGQNITDRAENFGPEQSSGNSDNNENKEQNRKDATSNDSTLPIPASVGLFENQASSKRKYEEVAVVTGEENEVNVMQMSAKLHWFDKSSGSWQERGRGLLRLNDSKLDSCHSRLVMRTCGSLRVILNTNLYKGMNIECPSDKNIRLTGTDEAGNFKVYLVSGLPKDIANLHTALKYRLASLREQEKQKSEDDENSEEEEDASVRSKAPRLA